MKHLISFALIAALATHALADTKITTAKHADASKGMGGEMPAKDSTQTTWFAKDKMRIEDGENVTIVRTDLKKMFVLHPSDKTYSAIDLPFDLKKYLPPEIAPMMEQQWTPTKITLTPTTETKKIKDWNTTKYTLVQEVMSMSMTFDIWATKDVTFDRAAYADLYGAMMSMLPGGVTLAAEFKKIDAVPILTEMTFVVTMMGKSESKLRDEVTAFETKDAPEGTYDVPKDFTEKPFDLMKDNPTMPKPPARGGKARPAGGPPPGDKPVDPPKPNPK